MRSFFLHVLLMVCSQIPAWSQLRSDTRIVQLMGSRFEISAVADNEYLVMGGINAGIAEIQRIEALISSWDPASQTSEINRQAGIKAVKVDKELFDLIYRAIKVSKLTDGAFDISFASMDNFWKFDGTMKYLPEDHEIKASADLIDYRNVILDQGSETVFLKKKGMKIGFGGIGKGYAANRARQIMKAMGINSGVVNAGGDLIAWGTQPDGNSWRVAIADPNNSEQMYCWLAIKDQAIVTSGDYERFVVIDGVRYAHIIDPRTGYPVRGLKSVTIISADAELSDALATAVFVMGSQRGLQLINRLAGIECLIVTDDNRMIASNKLHLNYVDE